jgi:hypothetical protein
MNFTNTKIKSPLIFRLLILVTLFEIFLTSFLHLVLRISYFQTAPYCRLTNIMFITYFVFDNRMVTKKVFFKMNLKSVLENNLVLVWFFASIVGFIFGLLTMNSISYLFVDFLYIVFGYFIYRVFMVNKDNIFYELNNIDLTNYLKSLVWFLIIISFIANILGIQLPYFFITFCLCLSFYLLKNKQKKHAILYWIPLFLQIASANRGLLIVFVIVLFFAWANEKFTLKKIKFLFIYIFLFLLVFIFISDYLFTTIISLLPNGSSLAVRIYQVNEIINGNVDWNSPMFLSIEQRFAEARIVVADWLKNPISFIFGKGLGATIDGTLFKDTSVIESAVMGKNNVHNIHLLPFSLLLKYGLSGIILFLMMLNLCLKYFFKLIINKTSSITIFILFNFCWIIYAIPAASVLWTCPFFWIFLALTSDERRKISE